jgi:hypothetical protein
VARTRAPTAPCTVRRTRSCGRASVSPPSLLPQGKPGPWSTQPQGRATCAGRGTPRLIMLGWLLRMYASLRLLPSSQKLLRVQTLAATVLQRQTTTVHSSPSCEACCCCRVCTSFIPFVLRFTSSASSTAAPATPPRSPEASLAGAGAAVAASPGAASPGPGRAGLASPLTTMPKAATEPTDRGAFSCISFTCWQRSPCSYG